MAAEVFSFTTQGVEFVQASLATRYFGREDLATYFPDPRESGWMFEALALLEDGLPVPPAFGPFRVGSFYRMPQHRRSCCLSRIRPGGEVTGPVVVLKGLEVLSPNIGQFLQQLAVDRSASPNLALLDHFAVVERKAPAAFALQEATQEAAIAQHIHRQFRLPLEELRLPLPLLVYRVGQAQAERYLAAVRPLTADYTFHIIEEICSGGLAVYAYLYPEVPVRHFNLDSKGVAASMAAHLGYLRGFCDPDVVIGRWCGNVAKLLSIGVLPATPLARFTGSCVDVNNAVMDGGLVDMDSCVQIHNGLPDRFVYESIESSIGILSGTILQYLCRGKLLSDQSRSAIRSIERYCFESIRESLVHASKAGLDLEPRVASYFFAPATLDRLYSVLDQHLVP